MFIKIGLGFSLSLLRRTIDPHLSILLLLISDKCENSLMEDGLKVATRNGMDDWYLMIEILIYIFSHKEKDT